MDNERCIALIKAYKKHRILWDPKEKNYYNSAIREDCWKKISATLNAPVTDIKSKMKSLMGTYRREKSRHKQSQITGLGRDSIYISKWFAYDCFDFLANRDNPSQTVDASTEGSCFHEPSVSITKTDDPLSERWNVIDQIPGPSSSGIKRNLDSENPSKKLVKKRRRTTPKTATKDYMLEKAFSILRKSIDVNTDPYFTYGQYIANELRKYDAQTLVIVKQAINNIIFNADLGRLQYPNQSNLSAASSSPSPSHTQNVTQNITQNQEDAEIVKDNADDILPLLQ